jgi:hypothetical protein
MVPLDIQGYSVSRMKLRHLGLRELVEEF